jgi:hypothetical protein
MLKKIISVTLGLLLWGSLAEAQYTMSLASDAVVDNGGAYEFDVNIQSTSGTITLTSYQLFFSYNTGIVKDGATLTFSYVSGSTALGSCTPSGGSAGIFSDGSSNIGIASNAGSDAISTTPVRVGTFRLASNIGFASGQSASVAWDFGGGLATVVNLSNSNATNPSNHTSSLGNSALPIQLANFVVGKGASGSAVLTWKTLSEVDNLGFDVERSLAPTGPFSVIAGSFQPGHGTTVEPHDYSYTDANTGGKEWWYRLKQTDRTGSVNYTEAKLAAVTSIAEALAIPTVYNLDQNYPNPFNPSTSIRYALPQGAHVKLVVYNMLGQEVAKLADDVQAAGYHTVTFDASSLGSGVYLYRLVAGKEVFLKKMLLVK